MPISQPLNDILHSSPDTVREALKGLKPLENIPPVQINLKTDRYLPPNFTAIPRQTPHHWKQAGKQFLQNLLEAGIIKPQCNPTTFTSLGFSNSPRFVVDYKSSGVNNQILCSHWPFTSPEVAGKSIPATMKWFIKLDLLSAFFQIPIEV